MKSNHPRPKYVTFDCYGTLINFEISKTTKELLGDRLPAEIESEFITYFSAIRVDEVLGPWKPYPNVIRDSLARSMARYGLEYRPSDGDALVEAIPTWGPHPEVPEALAKVAEHYPLVILSNADPAQIEKNVATLGAPFHKVLTSTAAKCYKPRHAAFEYLLDVLQCRPDELLHVSASIRYDIQTAQEIGIVDKVWVNRAEAMASGDIRGVASVAAQGWTFHEVSDLTGLPEVLGL